MQQKLECPLLNKLGIDCIFIFAGMRVCGYAGMGIQVIKKCEKCEIIGLITRPKGLLHIYDVQQKDGMPTVT